MGFLDLFRRRRATTELEQRVVAEWGSSAIPGPTEGAPGTYASTLAELRTAESSLQAVAVWSACDLIASVASQLPLDTYQRVSGAQPKQIPNGKLVQDPGGEGYGAQDWIYQYLMSKLLRGNSFGRQLSPDPSTGYPTQIVLYHPDCVQGWRDRIDGMVRWHVEGRQVPASQMWHRRSYPMPGTLLGMSPVGQHAVTIGQGMAAARFGLQFFTDGGVPGGILRNTETTVDQTLAAKVKAKWMAVMHGSREPAVLGKGWEWQGVSVNPEESQFLETQKYTSAQCARIFGPNVAEILGYETGGSMTYNTMVDRDMSFLKYTLNRWLVDLETTVFTPNLPKPQFVKFNRAALLSMDLLSRYRSYQLGIAAHVLTPDEAREYEDRPPLTEEQKRELIELNVKAPSPGGSDSNPNTARASDAGPKEQRAQPGDDEDLDDAGPLDDDSMALLTAIAELVDERQERGWDPAKHPRNPKGGPGGGRFRSMVDRLKDAIETHVKDGKDGHPFADFNREQLRKVAKARGITLKRGEDRDSIAAKLLDHLGNGNATTAPKLKPPSAPKKVSANPAEVSGRNSRWWTILREDTGMSPVPIRNLELDGGYTVKSGKAYRIDGITFLVEDGASGDADRIVEDFQDVHRELPPEADQYQQGYAWLAGRNPADAYWAKKYDIPNFRSAATAGDGAVRMWDRAHDPFGPASHLDSLMHEFGHNVSHAVRGRDLDDHSPRWGGAAHADASVRRPTDIKYSGRLALRLRNINFQRQRDRPYPFGVSNYGTSSPGEDYAESMAFYLGGKIGTGRLKTGGPEVPIYFRDLFPERANVLDQVFPEIAKRQKAAISAR